MADYDKIRIFLDQKKAEQKVFQDQLDMLGLEIDTLSHKETIHKKSMALCDVLIEQMNSASVEDIEKLITDALKFIFEKDYKFKMNPQVKRGSMSYSFTLNDNETEIIEAEGGGIVQVIAVLMRIITISISKPELKKILVLDESLGMVAKEFISNTSKFIKDLGNKLNFIIILVTHQDQFIEHADIAYRIDNGQSSKITGSS